MSDRKLQTNINKLASRSLNIRFKKKHEAFHSLTVAFFRKRGYWKCHTSMGVDKI